MFHNFSMVRSIARGILPCLSGLLVACSAAPCYAGGYGYTGSTQTQPMQAQAQVSMVLYQLKTGADGKQYAVVKDGSMVPLPPPGLAPGASQVAVYSDGKGNFWYQSPTGMAVPVTNPSLTWNAGATASGDSQKDDKKSKWQERRAQRRGRLGSFLGAATGAAVGTAVSNSMYGVPYGTPIYGNPNSMYYVGPNGSQVYLNLDEEALSSLYNQWTVQQQLVQQNRLNYQQQAQTSALQFQQQAQQNSLQHQQQMQQSRLNTQQQAIDNRQARYSNVSESLKPNELSAQGDQGLERFKGESQARQRRWNSSSPSQTGSTAGNALSGASDSRRGRFSRQLDKTGDKSAQGLGRSRFAGNGSSKRSARTSDRKSARTSGRTLKDGTQKASRFSGASKKSSRTSRHGQDRSSRAGQTRSKRFR